MEQQQQLTGIKLFAEKIKINKRRASSSSLSSDSDSSMEGSPLPDVGTPEFSQLGKNLKRERQERRRIRKENEEKDTVLEIMKFLGIIRPEHLGEF